MLLQQSASTVRLHSSPTPQADLSAVRTEPTQTAPAPTTAPAPAPAPAPIPAPTTARTPAPTPALTVTTPAPMQTLEPQPTRPASADGATTGGCTRGDTNAGALASTAVRPYSRLIGRPGSGHSCSVPAYPHLVTLLRPRVPATTVPLEPMQWHDTQHHWPTPIPLAPAGSSLGAGPTPASRALATTVHLPCAYKPRSGASAYRAGLSRLTGQRQRRSQHRR